VGCGVRAQRTADGWSIAGDPQHPANLGRLCSKGFALGETLGLEGRLLAPRIRGQETSWDHALDHVARSFNAIVAEHGPEAVAFYASGQLLTEDYYVANKLMKGFIGAANIDTNSRLCMSSAAAAHKRAFGEDLVPVCYEDLDLADMVVLVGSNTAWCHPVLFQRIVRAKQERPGFKLVVIDPRRTATCEIADLHLPVSAGSDVWLFNGLLAYLHRHGVVDTAFVETHTRGASRALLVADNTAGSVSAVAKACGISAELVEDFYRLFARTERVITAFSQGVNQSSQGTDKATSIINCHLLTGRIGKAGAGPFSITGQPNAMGGREVGGMANMLAAHMDIEESAHRRIVQDFWSSPTLATQPGLKAVDLFKAIARGKVKAVWIMATNPVVSMPDANKVRAALQRCELVVVSDCVANTDTNAFAHVLLPAAGWGEKDGTVTNSERRISRQRAFLATPGQARPDWWIVCQVARRMGFDAGFNFNSPREIFIEHARLSATQNAGTRAFDIGGLSELDSEQYNNLEPVQWPLATAGAPGQARLFGDHRYYFADGRARLVPTTPHTPVHARSDEYPLVLNTGRIRDQWHTMTRTGRAPRLTDHTAEPFVDLHPQDALLAGVRDGELARVSTRWGALVARVRMSGDLPRRMAFVPIHWSNAFSSDARVGALVNPAVDPVSGEPEFKHTPARVAPFVVSWQGFILSRGALAMKDVTWWTVAHGANFERYEIAGRRVHSNWSRWARTLLGAHDTGSDWLEYADAGTGIYRAVHIVEERIESCLFLSPRADLPSRSWLASLFGKSQLDASERAGLLVGRARESQADTGPTVCSCFGVGRNTICRAIRDRGLSSAQQIGQHLRAGTNCGSCVSELNALLAQTQ
jgi:assimilatory nitrate reductase catalytic subunit